MFYKPARVIFEIAKWFWPSMIVAFTITYLGNIAPLDRAIFVKGFSSSVMGYLFSPLFHLILTLSVMTILIVITLVAWILVARHKGNPEALPDSVPTIIVKNEGRNNRGTMMQAGGGTGSVFVQGDINAPFTMLPPLATLPAKELTDKQIIEQYCHEVISKNANLIPTGIANPASQALLSVSVPLDEVFIHLEAVSDRPLFDFTTEREKIQQEIRVLRRRQDLSPTEIEDYIQALKAASWQSEIGRGGIAPGKNQEVTIETVMQRLTFQQPVAVILGDPGAGKSTTMRWLALHMARAYCAEQMLPEELAPAQIPVLIRIEEYAKQLNDYERQSVRVSGQEPSFKLFFETWLSKIEPELSRVMKRELANGHCLLLFDGLDEVATDDLRLRIRDDIYSFMVDCLAKQQKGTAFNRFLITSRIVGYEPGPLTQYAEYTLHELNDAQIEQFLGSWCPAVERYQSRKEVRTVTAQDERRFLEDGEAQKKTLLRAMRDNPGIRRLVVNPLMLTILALIQKSGGKLPHRRIELYESITQTLLDNWNQTRGGNRLSHEDIQVAEEVLGVLAYERHSRDLLLTRKRVIGIARDAIAKSRGRRLDEISEPYVQDFIETLSQSSGLFGQKGQGLFDFIHRTFEEYYAAMYLLNKRYTSREALREFVSREYCHVVWYEPMLLAIASLNGQRDLELQMQANELIEVILQAGDANDDLLHRNLLLATMCVVDCEAIRLPAVLQQELIHRLLDLYGDVLGKGRYTALQQEIERVTLLWLRGQSEYHGPSQENAPMPVLLEAWRDALCDTGNTQRQEGAAHLLASLAPDLGSTPKSVLLSLVPPLLQLADALDTPGMPQVIQNLLPTPAAQPATYKVIEYAIIALRLLDADGPSGWLHAQWVIWDRENPALLERLTQHSLELDFLLTPAALPPRSNDPNWRMQEAIVNEWKQEAQHMPSAIQQRLLQASSAARYPHALLFWQLLLAEEQPRGKGLSWRVVWDSVLQQEMQRGRAVTYQTCLQLRSLLWKNDRPRQGAIVDLLREHLAATDNRFLQALISLRNVYLMYTRYVRDMRYMRDLMDLGYMRDLRYMMDLINRDHLIIFLCNTTSAKKSYQVTVLFALYSIISSDAKLPDAVLQVLQQTLNALELQAPLEIEELLFIKAIRQHLGIEVPKQLPSVAQAQVLPDARVTALNALKQRSTIGSVEVQEIIAACLDTRKLSDDVAKKLMGNTWSATYIVGEIAWPLLRQTWRMSPTTWHSVISFLNSDLALECAAAARFLQQGKDLPQAERTEAMECIRKILADEKLSRRPLDAPDGTILRLDDELYDTLRVLAG